MSDFEFKMNIAPEDWDKRMKEMKNLCICSDCPSLGASKENFAAEMMRDYSGGSHLEHFCYNGASNRIISNQGCNCSKCPVFEKMGLKHNFFCKQGDEPQQRGVSILSGFDDLFGDV